MNFGSTLYLNDHADQGSFGTSHVLIHYVLVRCNIMNFQNPGIATPPPPPPPPPPFQKSDHPPTVGNVQVLGAQGIPQCPLVLST